MEQARQTSNRSPINKHNIKMSSLVTEMDNERGLGIANLQLSRKQLTYSIFFDMKDDHTPFTPTTVNNLRNRK